METSSSKKKQDKTSTTSMTTSYGEVNVCQDASTNTTGLVFAMYSENALQRNQWLFAAKFKSHNAIDPRNPKAGDGNNVKTICLLQLALFISEVSTWKIRSQNSTIAATIPCNKSSFIRHYVDGELYPDENSMNQLKKQCLPPKTPCNGVNLKLQFMTDKYTLVPHVNIMLSNLTVSEEEEEEEGCWGYIVQIQKDGQLAYRYLNFHEKSFRMQLIRKLDYNSTYKVSVLSLPSIIDSKMTLETPDFPSLIDPTCGDRKASSFYNEFEQKRRVVHQLCSLYPSSVQQRVKAMKDIQRIQCDYYLHNNNNHEHDNNKNNNKKKKFDIPLTSVIILLTFFILFVTLLKVYKTPSMKKCCNVNLPNLKVGSEVSVLVLHRSGCDILEKLLRDFAYLLTLHGIDVKMTLLEQSRIDNEGGIASFLQRNLQSCDYVFILITEKEHAQPLYKHKPYEFALQIINGIALNSNNCSKYIPLYLSSYQETVGWFPSFLLAARHKGFKLPDDFNQLVTFLTGRVNHVTKQNDIIMNKMKTLTKKMKEKEHSCCLRERCVKGKQFISRSSLFSMWQSSDSLCNNDYIDSTKRSIDEGFISGLSNHGYNGKWNSLRAQSI